MENWRPNQNAFIKIVMRYSICCMLSPWNYVEVEAHRWILAPPHQHGVPVVEGYDRYYEVEEDVIVDELRNFMEDFR